MKKLKKKQKKTEMLRRNGPVVKSWGHAVLRLEGSLWCVMSNEYGTDKTITVTVT